MKPLASAPTEPPGSRAYKLSFMIEGRVMRESEAASPKYGEIKETIVTVKATKMEIQI